MFGIQPIIVVQDHEGDSKIYAFDKASGELVWERARDEGSTWATPLPVEVDGKLQIVTTGIEYIRGYDALSGDLIWQYGVHLTPSSCSSSPVANKTHVFCPAGDARNVLTAIELGHTGDLTDSDAVVWQERKGSPYVPSPLLYGDRVYFLKGNKPILSCYETTAGTPIFAEQRLGKMRDVYASPVAAAGRLSSAGSTRRASCGTCTPSPASAT